VGKRGPLPQAGNVRQLRGNPGKRPIKPAPKAVPVAPSCPSWLSATARAEFRRVLPELSRLNIVSNLDRAILSAYAQAYATMVAASNEMGSSPIIEGQRSKEPVKSPAFTVFVQATTLMVSLAKELGLTPYSRARMANPTDPALQSDSDLD
jgi:P27 family predicted phage terminase small subunit